MLLFCFDDSWQHAHSLTVVETKVRAARGPGLVTELLQRLRNGISSSMC